MKNSLLIDNNKHEMLNFKSIAELKRYAEENNMYIKKSLTSENCYYTESYL